MVFVGNSTAVYKLFHGLCMSLGWSGAQVAERNSIHLLCQRAQLVVAAPGLIVEQVCVPHVVAASLTVLVVVAAAAAVGLALMSSFTLMRCAHNCLVAAAPSAL